MPLFHVFVLALVQGVTEFLPISSSAHLVLVPCLTGWRDQGLVIDVAVHVGTLGAVIVYMWRDVGLMISGLIQAVTGGSVRRPTRGSAVGGPGGLAITTENTGAKLVLHLIIATVPVVVVGLLVQLALDDQLRDITVIAWATLGFAIVLYTADTLGLTICRLEHMTGGSAIIIGLAQILALIPGTSRAGITMTAARALGYERRDSARFSMLLSIPTIVAAGGLLGFELYQSGDARLTTDAALAAALAFAAALIAITLMMRWLARASFTPFVIYRILLGAALLALVYGWDFVCLGS